VETSVPKGSELSLELGDYPATGPRVVNAKPYDSAIAFTDLYRLPVRPCEAWAEYNISRNYATFTSVIGLDDDSPSGSTFTFRVFVDNQATPLKTVGVGETETISIDGISNGLRLKLQVSGEEVRSECATPIFANPTLTPVS